MIHFNRILTFFPIIDPYFLCYLIGFSIDIIFQ